MKVLDATFLIDYLNGIAEAKTFYEASGGDTEVWLTPVPAYAETIVGVGNLSDGDVDQALDALGVQVYEVDEQLSIVAARIAAEIGPQGPFLDCIDALIAAVGRELDATVVAGDSDLTHAETKTVVDVEEYR